MKAIYLIHIGREKDNQFVFYPYDIEVFTSKKKMLEYLEFSLHENKAINISIEKQTVYGNVKKEIIVSCVKIACNGEAYLAKYLVQAIKPTVLNTEPIQNSNIIINF